MRQEARKAEGLTGKEKGMTETLLELETRLVQAKEARHRLLTGTQEVSVSLQGYGSTTYTVANIEALERYINELELQISRDKGGTRRGIIRISF
jgi:hypothetical protein